MKAPLTLVLVLLALAAPRPQEGAQRYAKDGLSFDYPAGWTLEDKSNAEAQHLVLRRPDSSALFMVVALREPLQNVQQIHAARETITRPYVENLARQLGAPPPEAPGEPCLQMGASLIAGYRLAGRVAQEPATGEVYMVVRGQRLIHLIHVRHDKDEAATAPALKSVADTLKVEPPANASPEAERLGRIISGGVLNGKALAKPQPQYPITAKRARASGTVVVQITVDEKGEVASAQALSGHPLLRPAGEEAARRAKFSPTLHCGRAVRVTGVITYNFVIGLGPPTP